MTITLKHLARDFDLDPYAMRTAFRAAGLSPQINGRWKWIDEKNPEYKKAQEVARNMSLRLKSSSTSSSGTRGKSRNAPSVTGSSGQKAPDTSRGTQSN